MKISKYILLEGLRNNEIFIKAYKDKQGFIQATTIPRLSKNDQEEEELERIYINKNSDVDNFIADLIFNANDIAKKEHSMRKEDAVKEMEQTGMKFKIDENLWAQYLELYSS